MINELGGIIIVFILMLIASVNELNRRISKEYKQLKKRIEELEETVKELQDEKVIENYETYKANKTINRNTNM